MCTFCRHLLRIRDWSLAVTETNEPLNFTSAAKQAAPSGQYTIQNVPCGSVARPPSGYLLAIHLADKYKDATLDPTVDGGKVTTHNSRSKYKNKAMF